MRPLGEHTELIDAGMREQIRRRKSEPQLHAAPRMQDRA